MRCPFVFPRLYYLLVPPIVEEWKRWNTEIRNMRCSLNTRRAELLAKLAAETDPLKRKNREARLDELNRLIAQLDRAISRIAPMVDSDGVFHHSS